MSDAIEILLADNDAANAMGIQQGLAALGYTVGYAANSDLAVSQAERRRPDLAIIQLGMAGAVETARHLQDKFGSSIILCVDAEKGVGDAPMSELKPVGLISKPLRVWELGAVLPAAAALAKERVTSRERDRMLNGIVDGMLDSVLILNRQAVVTFANSTSSRLLKRPTSQLLTALFASIFPADGDGNNEIRATMDSIFADSGGAIGSGGRGTVHDGGGGRQQVVVIANPVRDDSGKVSAVSLSFRAAPPAQKSAPVQEEVPRDTKVQQEMILDLGGRGETGSKAEFSMEKSACKNDPLREQAIRAMAMRVDSSKNNYGVVLVLSQFDMFRMRYGITSAERLLHALSAQVMKTLPPEDRLYQWSNRALIALCERNSSLDEVRLEMTALCSRRIDYFLNAPERSALVTLSATWTLLPLYKTNLEKVIDQVDGFERQHSKAGG